MFKYEKINIIEMKLAGTLEDSVQLLIAARSKNVLTYQLTPQRGKDKEKQSCSSRPVKQFSVVS
jgi:hypothetical protein